MLRGLLAAMVPCLAIGLTGVFVTSIGRLLLAVPKEASPIVAFGLTIAIMVAGWMAASVTEALSRRRRQTHQRG